jgi:hypothetical protein
MPWGPVAAAGAANLTDIAVSPIAATVAIEQAFIQSAIRDLDAPTPVCLGETARNRIRRDD